MDKKPDHYYKALYLMAMTKYFRKSHWESEAERRMHFFKLAYQIKEHLIVSVKKVPYFVTPYGFNCRDGRFGMDFTEEEKKDLCLRFVFEGLFCAIKQVEQHPTYSFIGHIHFWENKGGVDNFKMLLEN